MAELSSEQFRNKRRRQWHKLYKKKRRQRIRQDAAKTRDAEMESERRRRENSPTFHLWLQKQEELEVFIEKEEKQKQLLENQMWLERERIAQEKWIAAQKAQEKKQAAKELQEKLIREEWEAIKCAEREKKEEQERLQREKQKYQETWINQLNEYLNSEEDIAPYFLPKESLVPIDPNREMCPFFTKTGACRFGDFCSRNHLQPSVSQILLIPGFYQHFGLSKAYRDEYDSDMNLEFEDSEIYQHFCEFYKDVLPELTSIGCVTQFKVCCNYQSHLQGNVYIQYRTVKEAVAAFLRLYGRWYDGRQLICHFVNIPSWRAAICGLFARGKCPKGKMCNFLHVFRNPSGQFREADRDWDRSHLERMKSSKTETRLDNEWRWSESPPSSSLKEVGAKSPDLARRKRSKSRSQSRTRSTLRKRREKKSNLSDQVRVKSTRKKSL